MNALQMISQLSKVKNPQAMMNNFIGNDSQKQQLWTMAQQIANSGGNTNQILENVCKQNNVDVNQVRSMLNQFGIKF